jgi:hypothetical protein
METAKPFNLQRCRVGGLKIVPRRAQRVEFLTSNGALTPSSRPVQAPDHTLSAIDNF